MAFFLVTGGAGFIGSSIVEELVNKGEKVRVLDNFSTGKRENIMRFKTDIELIEGDLRDWETVRRAVKGIEFVLHQGALPSVERSVKDPLTTNSVNVLGTLNVLLAGKEAKVKRIIYASSSSVYGNTPNLPKKETMEPNPQSPYAVSKLAGEKYCLYFYKAYGLETVCLRYFNVFGPRQDPDSPYSAVIPRFIRLLLKGESPLIYGDGEQSRDFTYVDNVVWANLQACRAKGIAGKVFNIACGKSTTVNELVKVLNEILGRSIKPRYHRARQGDVRHSRADISQAEIFLGYSPRVDFANGLEKTVEWFKNFYRLKQEATGK